MTKKIRITTRKSLEWDLQPYNVNTQCAFALHHIQARVQGTGGLERV